MERSGSNKLVLNKNRDLFYAVENTIRVCSINSKTKNYRVTKTIFAPFTIQKLGLNEQGTFLYSTDFKQVVVQNFPKVVNLSKSSCTSTDAYELKGLDPNSHILKIVWHPRIERGLSLIVLEANNLIKYYDLNLSEQPCMIIDLNKEHDFKDQKATSISFGSSANFIGGLTLYIASESSKIYAIYPFVWKKSKISLTKDEADRALAESSAIQNYVNEDFPDSPDDDFGDCIIRQIGFFKLLKAQMRNTPDEVKTNPNGDDFFYYSVAPKCFPSEFVHVQGPIADLKMGKISDLSDIGLNDDIATLLVINNDDTDLTVKYLSQLKPLVMAYGLKRDSMIFKVSEFATFNPVDEDFRSPTPLESISSTGLADEEDKPYSPPEVGFGYVDSDTDDESDATTASSEENKLQLQTIPLFSGKVDQTVRSQRQKDMATFKAQYWLQNFRRMEEISTDIIPNCQFSQLRKIIRSNIDPNRFLIYTPQKVIICSPHDDIDPFADLLINPEDADDSPNLLFDYKLIDFENNNASVTLVEDDLTFTGDYLISAFDESDRTVELYKIKEQEIPLTEKLSLETKDPEIKIESKIRSELLPEIESEKANVKPIQKMNYPLNSDDSNFQALQILNKFSKDSLQQVQIRSSLLIKLNLKISTNLMELKYQIDLLNKLSNISMNETTKARIKEIKDKQMKLNQRLKAVHLKLVSQNESLKLYKPIPLSNEEIEWFKEINKINATTGQSGTGDKEGLAKVVNDLSNQVDYIKKNLNSNSEKKTESLKYTNDLFQIKDIVNKQWSSLNGLKTEINGLIQSLGSEEES